MAISTQSQVLPSTIIDVVTLVSHPALSDIISVDDSLFLCDDVKSTLTPDVTARVVKLILYTASSEGGSKPTESGNETKHRTLTDLIKSEEFWRKDNAKAKSQ